MLILCLEPNEVLIKLNATGICHSDIHFMLNDWATPKMSAMGTKCAGHEGAGVIVKVGDQVKSLKPGMRAGLKVCQDGIQDVEEGANVNNYSQSKTLGKSPTKSIQIILKVLC